MHFAVCRNEFNIVKMKTKKIETQNVGGVEASKSVVVERFGAEKIAQWKSEYGKRPLSVITVADKVAVLRPITATELSQYSMMVASPGGGLDTASRYLLEELWIDGDNEIRDDEEYFMGAMLQLQNTIELKKSSFTRL